jgi:putative phosphoribosyl transferase
MAVLSSAEKAVQIPVGAIQLEASFTVPSEAQGVVIFAHGSGSGRHSPRNRFVAQQLQERRIATLLLDLLTAEEESVDAYTGGRLRFDIHLLATRLEAASDWAGREPATAHLPIGYFGASTGAAAALAAAADRPDDIRAVVSRGGRPDLAGADLARVRAPTLLIVGGLDHTVIRLNRDAMRRLRAETHLAVVPGATHLFEEPGAIEEVARLAGDWFERHF